VLKSNGVIKWHHNNKGEFMNKDLILLGVFCYGMISFWVGYTCGAAKWHH
jgi:hypothetical protein